MSYNVPAARTTGEFITASIWNVDLKDNIIALYAGALGLASQATNDFLYAASATQMARLAAVSGKVPKFNGSAWVMAGLQIELLSAFSGTDTNASAANVATYAMASGLSALDRLLFFYDVESVTQNTTVPVAYNSTDSVVMGGLRNTGTGFAGNDLLAGVSQAGLMFWQQAQSAVTQVAGNIVHSASLSQRVTFSTSYQGAWTWALRHGGVVAGGTFKYAGALFALRGQ